MDVRQGQYIISGCGAVGVNRVVSPRGIIIIIIYILIVVIPMVIGIGM
jgi:hypothetical protein